MKRQNHQELNELRLKFSDQQKRLNELNQEQGASSWVTTLPILDEGYDLTKQLFWDLIRMRYGWILTRLRVWNKIRHPTCSLVQERWFYFTSPESP